MDSSGTLELQLEAIKVRAKRVRVAVGAMKDWFTMDYSPCIERKNRAKTLHHGTGWEETRREMKQREREETKKKDIKLENDVHVQ